MMGGPFLQVAKEGDWTSTEVWVTGATWWPPEFGPGDQLEEDICRAAQRLGPGAVIEAGHGWLRVREPSPSPATGRVRKPR